MEKKRSILIIPLARVHVKVEKMVPSFE